MAQLAHSPSSHRRQGQRGKRGPIDLSRGPSKAAHAVRCRGQLGTHREGKVELLTAFIGWAFQTSTHLRYLCTTLCCVYHKKPDIYHTSTWLFKLSSNFDFRNIPFGLIVDTTIKLGERPEKMLRTNTNAAKINLNSKTMSRLDWADSRCCCATHCCLRCQRS